MSTTAELLSARPERINVPQGFRREQAEAGESISGPARSRLSGGISRRTFTRARDLALPWSGVSRATVH
jgi:hypothetical protein